MYEDDNIDEEEVLMPNILLDKFEGQYYNDYED